VSKPLSSSSPKELAALRVPPASQSRDFSAAVLQSEHRAYGGRKFSELPNLQCVLHGRSCQLTRFNKSSQVI